MKRFRPLAILLPLCLASANAKIGETPAQLEARYGKPIKEALDLKGNGMRVYHNDKFEQIRVSFREGVSRREEYKYTGDGLLSDEALDAIRAENVGQDVSDYGSVIVEPLEGQSTPWPIKERTGQEHAYSGRVETKKEDQVIVLRDRDTVVEIPLFTGGYLEGLQLESGKKYSITVLDEESLDTFAKIAVVGKRRHIDWSDSVGDPEANIQQLVRIKDGDNLVFDRSVCSIHHAKMELRNVEIAYGMLALSNNESYCFKHFPNFRDFVGGGCVVGEQKFASVYICPKCVAECNEYKRLHPEKSE